jgi:hypothetical protein
MIREYMVGGQRYAEVVRPSPYKSIWYVTWGDKIVPLWVDRPYVPDDIQ